MGVVGADRREVALPLNVLHALRHGGSPYKRPMTRGDSRRDLALSRPCRHLGLLPVPVSPGYINGAAGARLFVLWPRPEGDFADERWPVDVLESVTHEPTGWLTVCEQ